MTGSGSDEVLDLSTAEDGEEDDELIAEPVEEVEDLAAESVDEPASGGFQNRQPTFWHLDSSR